MYLNLYNPLKGTLIIMLKGNTISNIITKVKLEFYLILNMDSFYNDKKPMIIITSKNN